MLPTSHLALLLLAVSSSLQQTVANPTPEATCQTYEDGDATVYIFQLPVDAVPKCDPLLANVYNELSDSTTDFSLPKRPESWEVADRCNVKAVTRSSNRPKAIDTPLNCLLTDPLDVARCVGVSCF